MMRRYLLALLMPALAAADPLRVEDVARQDPPLRMHVATIDLSDPAVSVHVVRAGGATTRPADGETTLQLPTAVADREHFAIAVNGDLFMSGNPITLLGRQTPYYIGNDASVCGWAMTGGELWGHLAGSASLIVTKDRQVRITKLNRIDPDCREIASGSNMLLWNGRNVADHGGKNDEAYPRTAVGLDATGRWMTFIVVDGHRPAYSAGLSLHELADELLHRDCKTALNLDGGGSSVMVRKEGNDPAKVITHPSDGYNLPFTPSLQRPVAEVVGIKIDH